MNFRTLLALALCAPSVAFSYDMTRRDRMNILYSNQVVFDRRGEPLVSVRLTESQKKIEFSTRGGAVLMPSGDSGSSPLTGTHALDRPIGIEPSRRDPMVAGRRTISRPSNE